MSARRPLRCAIYTRKSTEEGLEQEFNSLDAQREACEAYVVSQKAEGWVALKEKYDDGGYSGGTLERPALRRLLGDIEAGRVDVVVVYKIDRLSRSLMDFARLVEVFDRKAVPFVSVTQAFNTTTSMGRLTLNVLLSFAQFERDVIGERIRDKFAASKRKGIWMGGSPPLGYDVASRKLVVNEAEAETVRLIFQRYLELGCVRLLCADLRERGTVSKRRVSEKGRSYGGLTLGRSALYLMLNNRTYLGETHHQGRYFKGEHKAIVPRPLFEAVQKRLAELAPASILKSRGAQDAPLTGLLFDEEGMAMLPTYTIKHGNQRYRYYTSRPAMKGEQTKAAIHRISAPLFEVLLTKALHRLGLAASDQATFAALVRRIDVLSNSIRIRLDGEYVRSAWRAAESASTTMRTRDFLAAYRDRLLTGEALSEEGPDTILLLPVRAKFRGGAAALYAPDDAGQRRPDPALLKAVARAWRWRAMLVSGEAKSIEDIATRHGQDRGHVGKILGLAFLSPAIIHAIVHGDQPPGLRITHLLDAQVPLAWDEQASLLRRLGNGIDR